MIHSSGTGGGASRARQFIKHGCGWPSVGVFVVGRLSRLPAASQQQVASAGWPSPSSPVVPAARCSLGAASSRDATNPPHPPLLSVPPPGGGAVPQYDTSPTRVAHHLVRPNKLKSADMRTELRTTDHRPPRPPPVGSYPPALGRGSCMQVLFEMKMGRPRRRSQVSCHRATPVTSPLATCRPPSARDGATDSGRAAH